MSSGGGGSSKHKKGRKRGKAKERDPDSWECTLCTYKNKIGDFKCEMCDTRKGTSTRKPRLRSIDNQGLWPAGAILHISVADAKADNFSSTVVEHQQIVQNFVVQQQQAALKSAHSRSQSRAEEEEDGPSSSGLGAPDCDVTSPRTEESYSSAEHSPSTSKTTTPRPTPSPSLRSTPPSFSGASASGASRLGAKVRKHLPPSSVSPRSGSKSSGLRGVDKNSARTLAVTVNGLTVVITDYRLKKPRAPRRTDAAPAPVCSTTTIPSPEKTVAPTAKDSQRDSADPPSEPPPHRQSGNASPILPIEDEKEEEEEVVS